MKENSLSFFCNLTTVTRTNDNDINLSKKGS